VQSARGVFVVEILRVGDRQKIARLRQFRVERDLLCRAACRTRSIVLPQQRLPQQRLPQSDAPPPIADSIEPPNALRGRLRSADY